MMQFSLVRIACITLALGATSTGFAQLIWFCWTTTNIGTVCGRTPPANPNPSCPIRIDFDQDVPRVGLVPLGGSDTPVNVTRRCRYRIGLTVNINNVATCDYLFLGTFTLTAAGQIAGGAACGGGGQSSPVDPPRGTN